MKFELEGLFGPPMKEEKVATFKDACGHTVTPWEGGQGDMSIAYWNRRGLVACTNPAYHEWHAINSWREIVFEV